MGSTNAAVLPVPVWAQPMISRPFEGRRDRLGLNFCGGGVAAGENAAQQRVGKTHGGKGHYIILTKHQKTTSEHNDQLESVLRGGFR